MNVDRSQSTITSAGRNSPVGGHDRVPARCVRFPLVGQRDGSDCAASGTSRCPAGCAFRTGGYVGQYLGVAALCPVAEFLGDVAGEVCAVGIVIAFNRALGAPTRDLFAAIRALWSFHVQPSVPGQRDRWGTRVSGPNRHGPRSRGPFERSHPVFGTLERWPASGPRADGRSGLACSSLRADDRDVSTARSMHRPATRRCDPPTNAPTADPKGLFPRNLRARVCPAWCWVEQARR